MNQERRSVESPQTNAIRLPAISLPVAERQGYHQLTLHRVRGHRRRPTLLVTEDAVYASDGQRKV